MDYLEIEEKVAKMDITLPPPEPEADRQYYFIRKLQLWMEEKKKELYVEQKKSGTVVKGPKIGRTDPCPCGSGKKYKHCCGKNK